METDNQNKIREEERDKIENEITEKIEKAIKDREMSKLELNKIIETQIKSENYIREDWQVDYAVGRIKENLKHIKFHKNLSSEQNEFISRFSYGAVICPFIWAIANRLYLWAIGSLVPFLNIYIWFKLFYSGRKIAWENGGWKDFNHFKKCQIFIDRFLLIIVLPGIFLIVMLKII